jgi:hypothetical protein
MKPEKPDPEVPSRLVATWADAVLNTAGEKPKRGFGGRLSFFKRDSDDPVRVEGQLVVYAFDETSRAAHETQPTRRYIFPLEEFARHESDSKLGPSYSFWLPWDDAGGPQRNISLIVRFEPKGGSVVMGEQTRHLLPGDTLDGPSAGPTLASERSAVVERVQLAAFNGDAATPSSSSPASETPEARQRMSTETIALPPRLGNTVAQTPVAARTGVLPLSQLSSMQTSTTEAPPATATGDAAAQAARASSAAASGPAAPGSLRGSLLETLPARGTPIGRPTRDRAR